MSLLWLSSASPLFFYSPDPVYFSGSAYTAPWTGSLEPGQAAPNNSVRSTAGPGAVILPSIYATSFTPYFIAAAEYAVTRQVGSGQAALVASGQNYTFEDFSIQTFTLGVGCATEQCAGTATAAMGFYGAWVGTQYAPPGSAVEGVQLDDGSPLVSYAGFAPLSASPAGPQGVNIDPADYQGTLSMTTTEGASASVTFNGASILVTGLTGPSLGSYTVTLDGVLTATLSAHNDVVTHGTILYFTSNLDPGMSHTLVITATAGSETSPVPVDGGNATSSTPVTGQGAVGLVLDSWTAYGPQGAVGFTGTINGATTTLGPSPGGPISGPTGVSPWNPPTPNPSTFPTESPGIADQATGGGSPNVGVIIGALLGTLAGLFLLLWLFRRQMRKAKKEEKKLNPWDQANLLQNMKNEMVHVTTVAKQRYVYPGMIAHSELKKF